VPAGWFSTEVASECTSFSCINALPLDNAYVLAFAPALYCLLPCLAGGCVRIWYHDVPAVHGAGSFQVTTLPLFTIHVSPFNCWHHSLYRTAQPITLLASTIDRKVVSPEFLHVCLYVCLCLCLFAAQEAALWPILQRNCCRRLQAPCAPRHVQ
jgi:hypothetical protein